MRRWCPGPHCGAVKVALVAETFLPHMNGVVGSILNVIAHLRERGHDVVVIAPRHDTAPDPAALAGADLLLLPSAALPGYPALRLALPTVPRMVTLLRAIEPDVVHLASPFVLGWQAVRAAEHLGIPTVAVYQTDVPGYAERYGVAALGPVFARHVARLHQRATLTLSPSTAATAGLRAWGVDDVRPWARGVDGERFHPRHRDEKWRRVVAPGGELVIGYVGRLAPEKQVLDLAAIADIPGTRVVIIGDGPQRATVQSALPDALVTGFLGGSELARAVASCDIIVHPGENETFCQTVQEALASGVPVVATGAGGPLDLVQSSHTGWLYRPGDLDDLRARVLDLVGDPAKRRAFAAAARASVAHRTWRSLGDQLLVHYADARTRHAQRAQSAVGLSNRGHAA